MGLLAQSPTHHAHPPIGVRACHPKYDLKAYVNGIGEAAMNAPEVIKASLK